MIDDLNKKAQPSRQNSKYQSKRTNKNLTTIFTSPNRQRFVNEETKSDINNKNQKPFTRDKPFEYSSNSDIDNLDSDFDDDFEPNLNAIDQNNYSPKTPQTPQRMKSQSQRKLNDIHYLNKYNKNLNSEDSEEDNWINSNLKRNKNIEASQTPSCSIKIPSSTSNHTTPNAQ